MTEKRASATISAYWKDAGVVWMSDDVKKILGTGPHSNSGKTEPVGHVPLNSDTPPEFVISHASREGYAFVGSTSFQRFLAENQNSEETFLAAFYDFGGEEWIISASWSHRDGGWFLRAKNTSWLGLSYFSAKCHVLFEKHKP